MSDMEGRSKWTIGAAAAAAFVLAVALGAGGALAVSDAFSDDERQVAIDEVTETPDVEQFEPSESLNEALDFLVDEAVEAGRLTEEEGAELKELLDSGVTPSLIPRLGDDFDFFDGRDFDFLGPGWSEHFGVALDLDAAASYLDLTSSELDRELAEGKTLAQVARDQGKPIAGLVDVLVDAAEARIDDAVADGRLSEERAADLKEGLEERMRDRVVSERLIPFGEFWRDLGEAFEGEHG
jgi:polyhydroxyalkanoate synthesis regulator phasin